MMLGVQRVKLDVFEGPLDLLLHLIKRNEVEIADIPIAPITDQYLAAIEQLDDLNLDSAGEYVLMAATLMLIKSRMLLPRDPAEVDEGDEDPRAELVQQLLEYQRYREAALQLGDRPVLSREVFRSPGQRVEPGPVSEDGPPVRDAELADLLTALRAVLARARALQPHEILRPGLSIAEGAQNVLARFALDETVEFGALFAPDASLGEVLVTFLALLELIRLRVVHASQGALFAPILLTLAVPDLAEASERIRDLHDFEPTRGGEHVDGDGSVEA
jgi:segregation and condensation protein A